MRNLKYFINYLVLPFLCCLFFSFAVEHAMFHNTNQEKNKFMQQCTTKYDRADCEIFWHGGRIDRE